MLHLSTKAIFAAALIAITSAANAIPLALFSHNFTTSSGVFISLITDGGQVNGGVGASQASWDWDGTTLTATGLYTATLSINGDPFTASIWSDSITNLSINTSTSTANAASYFCVEGTFLPSVGFSGCGGYDFGSNGLNDSTTTWGPGTAVSQTLGGDDVFAGGPRTISAYEFGSFYYFSDGGNGSLLVIGNGIALGSQSGGVGGQWMCFGTLVPGLPSCEDVIALAIAPVPVPAAAWLFGSALGLVGWMRRRAS